MTEDDPHKYYFKVKKEKLICPKCYNSTTSRVDMDHKWYVYLCLDCAREEGFEG